MSLLAVAVASGCGKSPPVVFRSNQLQMVAANLVPEHRQQVAAVMVDLFGTPDEPRAPEIFELDSDLLARAVGCDVENPRESSVGLYRQHCAHCHGVTGDGTGPTAQLLDPYPRDFRAGKFKFKSTYLSGKPTDADLRRVLVHGAPGTAMPSFRLLDNEQIDALVEYVKYLSIRGEVESMLIVLVADEMEYDVEAGTTDDPFVPADNELAQDLVDEALDMVAEGWLDAEENVVEQDEDALPPDDRTPLEIAASAAKGRELFFSERGGCLKCHGETGLGDGPQVDYDDWSKEVFEFTQATDTLAGRLAELTQKTLADVADETVEVQPELVVLERQLNERQFALVYSMPVRQSRPRNLRRGEFRGGGRPVDLYLRIHQGIAGTPMPAHGAPRPGATGALTDEEIWNLVDYIRSLPYEESHQGVTSTADSSES